MTTNLDIQGAPQNRVTANAADLAADYKARGIERSASYSKFVQDRALRPEMDASEFFALYDAATPALLPNVGGRRVKFAPTHHDTLLDMPVMVETRDDGVREMAWADGHTGSEPPVMTFNSDRYKKIEGD